MPVSQFTGVLWEFSFPPVFHWSCLTTQGSPVSQHVVFLLSPHLCFITMQIIFHFRWGHWAHYDIFENGVLLMYTPEGLSSIVNFITAYEES